MDQKGQPDNSAFDRSNSQYAVLGAWAVEQAGAEMPSAIGKTKTRPGAVPSRPTEAGPTTTWSIPP